jgi:hypothetical protein
VFSKGNTVMTFWSFKKSDAIASDTASLTSQLESAKRRITELMLENIQQAAEIQRLQEWRISPPARPVLASSAEVTRLPARANSEPGRRVRKLAS